MEEGFLILGGKAKEGFLYDFLAGIDYFNFGGIEIGKWLVGIGFLLFGAAIWLEGRRHIMAFEMVRFDSRKKWWNKRFGKLLLIGMAGGLLYESCMLGLDLLLGKEKSPGMEVILILLLWLVHMMVMISVFCLLELRGTGAVAPALLLAVEVSSFILGFYVRNLSKYMFGCWGMYMQSSEAEEIFGFSPAAVLALEVLMILASWRWGAKRMEGKDTRWNI